MRRPLHLRTITLVTCALATDAQAGVTVIPDDGCPAGATIEANLDRLGTLSSLAQLGSAEVRVQETSLRVSFRDLRGESLGARTVTASPDCRERATLAAAVIATYAGNWAKTKLADPAPSSPAGQTPSALLAASPPTGTTRPWQAELGAMAFGVHDGDVGTLGLAGRADLRRGGWMATAIVEGSWPRERPLGSGQGAYRFLRAGLGPGIRSQGNNLFWDAAALAMVERLSLDGMNLHPGQQASDWDFVIASTTRLGWNGRRIRPFLFLAASYSFPQQNMILTGRADVRSLSQINVEAGLGISLGFLP